VRTQEGDIVGEGSKRKIGGLQGGPSLFSCRKKKPPVISGTQLNANTVLAMERGQEERERLFRHDVGGQPRGE